MDAGATWERLLHTPTTWIVVAVVLFVIAVVLLVAGARAGRRASRAQRGVAAGLVPMAADEDPVTEPAVPRRAPAAVVEDDPVSEPAVSRDAGAGPTSDAAPDPAVTRLLAALVDDPRAALAGVGALERGEEPGRVAVSLLRSGVPAPAVARLCGVDADELGGLVAATLGVLPDHTRAAVTAADEEQADEEQADEEPADEEPAGTAPAWAGTPSS
ncbi:MAG TPA: hypothetical protein VGH76_09695 [Actinomycetospora sp.]|jgi:hypothetical protein|uniref:hypothetical protein n=1 Tax=Actinomycetospora sp. TaxID=1872135 RepID=UPI002F42FB36